MLYHQEDSPGSLFVLLRGRVKIRLLTADRRRQVTLAWVQPGSFFGTTSVFSGGHHNSDAVAVEESEVLVLKGDLFRAYLREHPEVVEDYIESIVDRWSHTIQRFYELAFLDVPGRLAKVLLQFAGDSEQEPEPVLLKSLTQRDLASLVGTTRESINKWMLFFVRRGWIEFSRGRIKILKPEELRRSISDH